MTALIVKYGAMLIAGLVALLSVWYAGKTKGSSVEKVKASEQKASDQEALKVAEINRTKAETQTEVKTIGAAHEATTEVNAMSDAAVFDELRRDYTKD